MAALRADPAFGTVHRSLDVYHGDAGHIEAVGRLVAPFLPAGGLAFDIGSHVGDRVRAFRSLGARVIACEPQPICFDVLGRLFADDSEVTLLHTAVGASAGSLAFHVNTDNPTVSTAAPDLIAAARDAEGWHDQRWDRTITVPVTTLDDLIAAHGRPDFVKIDVEGFEAEVLAGLSTPLAALSFEFTTIQKPVALACLDRLDALGQYEFNASLGETQTWAHARWVDAGAMAAFLTALEPAANSGDVYARRLAD